MKKTTALTILLACAMVPVPAWAEIPQAIHYQGYLADADGNPLDETVELDFRLYDVEVAGEAFWTTEEPLAVDIQNGVFRVTLAPITAEELAAGDVWMGITVVPSDQGEPMQEMEPRLKVLSVPYALVAQHAASSDFAGEAGSVTDIDFTVFATNDDVQEVQGVCIQEADLAEALAGYCPAPCYGEADVELYLTEKGFLPGAGYTDQDVQAYLDLAGYVSGPHYSDGDVEALLAMKNYCEGPCFTGSYNDLSDKPNLDGHDAATVDGFDTNATGQPVAQTIPITDGDGKIPEELLPFSKGDLLAPADRQLVEGLDEYESGYFSVEELGIEGDVAANVKEGVKFGPGDAISGTLVATSGMPWWEDPEQYAVYDDFSSQFIDEERWTVNEGEGGGYVVAEDGWLKAMGGKPAHASATMASPIFDRSIWLQYDVEVQKYYDVGGNGSSFGLVRLLEFSSVGRAHPYGWKQDIAFGNVRGSRKGTLRVESLESGEYRVLVDGVETEVKATEGGLIVKVEGMDSSIPWGNVFAKVHEIRVKKCDRFGDCLTCDDGNVCTSDYFVGGDGQQCKHVANTSICDDGNACTSDDSCSDAVCAGLPLDCDDKDDYTADSCDVVWGCQHERCVVAEYEFTESAEEWKLNADWSWSEGSPGAVGGYLQGKVGNTAVESPVFPAKSGMLHVRYKCLGTGGLAFLAGPSIDCQFPGDWEESYVQLDGEDWLVKFTHYGTGDVLVDRVEVLEQCM